MTKTFKISPDKNFELMKDTGVKKASPGDVYSAGAPAEPKFIVTKADGVVLTEGVDYNVKYTNNRRPTEHAKFTVNFIGNYKGRRSAKGEFIITEAPFGKASVSTTDLVYLKPGKLKPEITITYEGNVLKNNSDYTYKLFKGTEDITSKKQTFTDVELPVTITVKATGKGSFNNETAEGSFVVSALPEGAFDLTDAKILEAGTNKALKQQDYTGRPVRPAIDVLAKVKGSKEFTVVPPEAYRVEYFNNIARGKAKLVVKGDNKKAFGSRTGSFTIGTRKIAEIIQLIMER